MVNLTFNISYHKEDIFTFWKSTHLFFPVGKMQDDGKQEYSSVSYKTHSSSMDSSFSH